MMIMSYDNEDADKKKSENTGGDEVGEHNDRSL